MREIKFRVWDIENKIMIYPNHLNHKKFLLESDGDLCGLDLNTFTWLGVLSNKLFKKQLYTGLKDKNDKEIYEGDILKVYDDFFRTGLDDECGVIKFDSGSFYLDTFREYPNVCLEQFEIIGNIYEDKHLLKENK